MYTLLCLPQEGVANDATGTRGIIIPVMRKSNRVVMDTIATRELDLLERREDTTFHHTYSSGTVKRAGWEREVRGK